MASVTYDKVYKRYGDVTAVNNLNIAVDDKDKAADQRLHCSIIPVETASHLMAAAGVRHGRVHDAAVYDARTGILDAFEPSRSSHPLRVRQAIPRPA